MREQGDPHTTIAETTDALVIVADIEGRITYFNRACEELTGYSRDEIIGTFVWEFLLLERCVEPVKQMFANLMTEGMPNRFENAWVTKGGEERLIAWSNNVTKDAEGKVTQVIGTGLDVTERKRAEEELRKSEEKYRELADSISDTFFAFDEELRYTYWNRASEQLTGISANDALGKHLYDLFPDVEMTRKAEKAYLKALRTKQPQYLVNEYQLGGKNFVFEISAYPSKAGLSVFVKDITERKQAEQALQVRTHALSERVKELNCLYGISSLAEKQDISLEEVLQGVVNLVPPAWQYPEITCARITIGDKEFKTDNFKTTEWKQTANIRIGGHKEGTIEVYYLQGRPDIDEGPFSTEERALIEAIAEVLGRIAERMRMEEALRQAHDELEQRVEERTEELVKSNGQLRREITERKRAHEALRDSEERYRQIFEGVDDVVMVYGSQGEFLDCNESTLHRLGYSRQEFLRLRAADIVHPDYHLLMQDNQRAIWAGERTVVESAHRCKDGRVIPVEVNARRIEYQGQSAILAVVRDITERKHVEEALRVLSRRLVEAGEMERQHIARELHDQVGQSLTALNLLLETAAHSPKNAEANLRDTKDMVSELVARVRDLSLDLRPPMLEDLGLLPTLQWHFDRYTSQTAVRVNFGHKGLNRRFGPQVELAAYRIVQEALTNVARHVSVDEVTVELWTSRDALGIRIEDRGAGFNPNSVLGSAAGSGVVGMGERARSLGGQLTVESAPGVGTRLKAELPLRKAVDKRRRGKG